MNYYKLITEKTNIYINIGYLHKYEAALHTLMCKVTSLTVFI